jgi:hypothetical protein
MRLLCTGIQGTGPIAGKGTRSCIGGDGGTRCGAAAAREKERLPVSVLREHPVDVAVLVERSREFHVHGVDREVQLGAVHFHLVTRNRAFTLIRAFHCGAPLVTGVHQVQHDAQVIRIQLALPVAGE